MRQGVALVGAGTWGANWVRVLLRDPETRLVAVCDPDEAALARAAGEAGRAGLPSPLLLRDPGELATVGDIAGVVVASPISSHAAIARPLIDSGRHVLIEKPLATSRSEAAELAALARARGVSLAAGHTFLYSAGAEAFRDVLASGRLGPIRFISSERGNYGRFGPKYGPLWELAAHDVALVLWWRATLAGRPEQIPLSVTCVTGPSSGDGPEDYCSIALDFPDGLVAFVGATWRAPLKVRRTLASGELGMALYEERPEGPVVTHYPTPAGVGPGYPRGEDYPLPTRAPGEDPLTLEYRDWRRSWTSGGPPRSDSELAVAVVAVLEAAGLSARRKGAPVLLEEVG